jgi:hypothetical protein
VVLVWRPTRVCELRRDCRRPTGPVTSEAPAPLVGACWAYGFELQRCGCVRACVCVHAVPRRAVPPVLRLFLRARRWV